IAAGARAHGAETEYAWRLAARVRARLAHSGATSDPERWAAFLADPDARWAAGLGAAATPADAPAWLAAPERTEAAGRDDAAPSASRSRRRP
ncbi:MAG: hypothetical protein ACKOC6_08645, partial [bacterium]